MATLAFAYQQTQYQLRCGMDNKERLALAERVQKNIIEQCPAFHILKVKEEIEREYQREK